MIKTLNIIAKLSDYKSLWAHIMYLCFALSATILFFRPIEIYLNNHSELAQISLTTLLGLSLSYTIFMTILLFIIIVVLKRQLGFSNKSLATFLFYFLCIFYIQGNLISNIDTHNYAITALGYRKNDYYQDFLWFVGLEVGIAALLGVIIYWLHDLLHKVFIKVISIYLIARILFVFFLGFQNRYTLIDSFFALEELHNLHFSKQQNTIVLFIDSYGADVFKEVMRKYPENKYSFKDFTFYSNVYSGFALTEYVLPAFFFGSYYEGHGSFNEYIEQIEHTPTATINTLRAKGWLVNGYRTYLSFFPDGVLSNVHLQSKSAQQTRAGYPYLLRLSISSVMPLFFYFEFNRLLSLFYAYADDAAAFLVGARGTRDEALFKLLLNNSFVRTVERPVLSIVRFKGLHAPYEIDAHGLYGKYDLSKEVAVGTGEAYLKVIGLFFERLKKEKIYDQATIIVLGDHGIRDVPFGGNPLKNQYNPVVLVKRHSAKNTILKEDSRLLMISDIAKLMDPEVVDIVSRQGIYVYKIEKHRSGKGIISKQYIPAEKL